MKMTAFEHLTMNSSLDLHENRITYRKKGSVPRRFNTLAAWGTDPFFTQKQQRLRKEFLKKIESNSHNKIGRQ